MISVIAIEIAATQRRRRLSQFIQQRLANDHSVPKSLERELFGQLTHGLDFDQTSDRRGLLLPIGGHYQRLVFWPLVTAAVTAGAISGTDHLKLPNSKSQYLAFVSQTTGIGEDHYEDMHRKYRVDPLMLASIAEMVMAKAPAAWCALMSHRFAHAERLLPELGQNLLRPAFDRPVVRGFKILAQFERGTLIMRQLARMRELASVEGINDMLASSQPLYQQLSGRDLIDLYRLIEYNSFSTNTVRDFILLSDRGALPRTEGHLLWHLQQGEWPAGTQPLAEDKGLRLALRDWLSKSYQRVSVEPVDTEARRIIAPYPSSTLGQASASPASVFRDADPLEIARDKKSFAADRARGGRYDVWRTDAPARWYGLTNELLAVVIVEDCAHGAPVGRPKRMKQFQHIPHKFDVHQRTVTATLSNALRAFADPRLQTTLEAAAALYVRTRNTGSVAQRDVTFEKLVLRGQKASKRYLPRCGRPGSGPRYIATSYGEASPDGPLWRVLQNDEARTSRKVLRRHVVLEKPQWRKVFFALFVVRNRFEKVFEVYAGTIPTANIAADLAMAWSPISGNTTFAQGLKAVLK